MTLHAFNKQTNKSMKWVALPLELVDWMALHFSGQFIAHLASIDPYKDVLIPDSVTVTASDELGAVRNELRGEIAEDVPQTVDLFGKYGVAGAQTTLDQLIELLIFAKENDCKVVSVGD